MLAGRRVLVERDIPVPVGSGLTLLADRYVPARKGSPAPPTILIRSPMGRRPLGILYGRYFARHGFQVLVQDAREAGDFRGHAIPLSREREDGLATIEWLRAQPWFTGRLATHGMSALGFSQWAIAAQVPELAAMSVQMSASSFADTIFTGGSFGLESLLVWLSNHNFSSSITAPARVRRAVGTGRPFGQLDVLASGVTLPFFQGVLADPGPGSALRKALDHSHATRQAAVAPAHLVAGWYDVFVQGQLRDYLALRAAGHEPHLTVGPWAHYDPRHLLVANREALAWFRAHLLGDRAALRGNPVRLYITGAGEWREYPCYPPPGTKQFRWHLQPGGMLAERAPEESGPDLYTYDPADATPAPRGPVVFGDSRPADNRPIERRPDVLTYTTTPLHRAIEVIGTVSADLYIRSSRAHTDFVVRLCDVHPNGASMNICEGLLRLTPKDGSLDREGVRRIGIELYPAGHRFKAGHRLRVQVCSGATPRFPRNLGTGDHSGTAMMTSDQEVFHDPARPSLITIPTVVG
ncbi:CocE/NonD family hydrolase [Streptomyces sp. NPDC002533]